MNHVCATCGTEIQPGHLLCRTCWHQLPRSLRRRVNLTWGRYNSAGNLDRIDAVHQQRLHKLLTEYRSARQAAIDYLHGGEAA